MDGMPAEIETLWQSGTEMLRDAGAEIVDISLPHTKYALPAYYVIAPAEASQTLHVMMGCVLGIVPHWVRAMALRKCMKNPRRRIWTRGSAPRDDGTYVLSAGFYDAYYNRARAYAH